MKVCPSYICSEITSVGQSTNGPMVAKYVGITDGRYELLEFDSGTPKFLVVAFACVQN